MRGELHYTLTTIVGARESVAAERACSLRPRFNIAPGQDAPVALVADRARIIEQLRWGLLPRWRGHGGKRGPLVHAAPIEAVAGTPLLREAMNTRRCLVLADGCFAWRELKQPIWFHPDPCRVIAFAGLWNKNDDDDRASFALLLGPPLATRVRHPMPIVLVPEAYDAWLDPALGPDVVIQLLVSTPPPGWRADAVTTRMASAQHDDPKCIEPIGNPNQGELF